MNNTTTSKDSIPTDTIETTTGVTMDPSRDMDKNGINDCEKDGTCDDTVDYTKARTAVSQSTDTTTKEIILTEIAMHATESDCWTAINGTVYDVTAFFGKHPGGDKNLFRVCGIDATQAFNKQHDSDTKPKNILVGFEIGTLAQ